MQIKEYKWSITDGRDSQPRAQEATRPGLNILLKTIILAKYSPCRLQVLAVLLVRDLYCFVHCAEIRYLGMAS